MRELPVATRSVAVDVTSVSWAYDGTTSTDRPIGIQCNASTTITGALSGDTAETAWVLPAGVWYLAFKSINTSSTTKSGYKILYGSP